MFLIGTKKSSNEKSLKLENYKFGDILQGNFSDGYNYLPHKTIMSYIWINRFEKLAFDDANDSSIPVDFAMILWGLISRYYGQYPSIWNKWYLLILVVFVDISWSKTKVYSPNRWWYSCELWKFSSIAEIWRRESQKWKIHLLSISDEKSKSLDSFWSSHLGEMGLRPKCSQCYIYRQK